MDHQTTFVASRPLSHEAGLVLQSCLIRASHIYDGRRLVTPFGLAFTLPPECSKDRPGRVLPKELEYQRPSFRKHFS